MGGGRAPARQGAPTAAIAASPARNSQYRHLTHVAVSSAHAGKHAHAWGRGWGNAAVVGSRGGMLRGDRENGQKPACKVA